MSRAKDTMRADARRNLDRIRLAAREVYGEAGLDAPMDEVARRAGVGVGTIYRRFPNKEALLYDLCLEALGRLTNLARDALAEEDDGWEAFRRFMYEASEQGAGTLLPNIAGRVPVTDEILAARSVHDTALQELVRAAQKQGGLRRDIGPGDVPFILTCAAFPASHIAPEMAITLRRRYLDVMLDGLRESHDNASLSGKPLVQSDVDRMYFEK